MQPSLLDPDMALESGRTGFFSKKTRSSTPDIHMGGYGTKTISAGVWRYFGGGGFEQESYIRL